MTDREKLYNLFQDINCPNIFMCNAHELQLAEYLVSNGVTFATDTNDGHKWIRVEDEKPADFVSVLGHMTDAGDFPAVRECYHVDAGFYFPALREIHPIDKWAYMPEPSNG